MVIHSAKLPGAHPARSGINSAIGLPLITFLSPCDIVLIDARSMAGCLENGRRNEFDCSESDPYSRLSFQP